MTDSNAQLRGVLTSYLWRLCQLAADPKTRAADPQKGPRHPYIRLVNREAERLLKAFRSDVREQVRQLPGRAQKGAVNAALRSVTPKIAKALKA